MTKARLEKQTRNYALCEVVACACRSEVFLKPREDAAVSEISVVLKEWKPLWHQLFTVSQRKKHPRNIPGGPKN